MKLTNKTLEELGFTKETTDIYGEERYYWFYFVRWYNNIETCFDDELEDGGFYIHCFGKKIYTAEKVKALLDILDLGDE